MVRPVKRKNSKKGISILSNPLARNFVFLFLVLASAAAAYYLVQNRVTIFQRASYDPSTRTFSETFDGDPASPQPFTQLQQPNWDVQVHSRDSGTWYNLEEMDAMHGSDCAPPPTSHHIAGVYEDSVFNCKNHLMTAIKAGGYGLVVLTPNAMADISTGESVIKFDLSTARMSSRDWIDVWVSPFEDNITLPFDQGDVDLQGHPKEGVHINMSAFNGESTFRAYVARNYVETEIDGCWWCSIEGALKDVGRTPSMTQRDTFELRISKTHVKFWMPATGMVWVDKDIDPLTWDKGVVQFGHHSYNPEKDNSGIPATWHWDNVNISPSTQFSMIKADKRYVNSTTDGQKITFNSPAPANAYLRFAAVGEPMISLDNGATYNAVPVQKSSQEGTKGDTLWGHAANFFTPIPEGTQSVHIKLRAHPGSWYTEQYGMIAQDFAIWSQSAASSQPQPTSTTTNPTNPPSVPTATPTNTPTPTPTNTPTPTPTSTASDTVAPTVAIISPTNGSFVSTKSTRTGIQITATDNVGIQYVAIYINGKLVKTDYSTPYNYNWYTKNLPKGSYILKATARDKAGNTSSSQVTVYK